MKKTEERNEHEGADVSPGKGICQECAFYTDCPRMKGINQCYNLHRDKPDEENKAEG